MHLYNAWLPSPVAEETKKEKESFNYVVRSVKDSWRSDDPESLFSTLKWISVIDLYIKAKSEVALDDVAQLVDFGLHLFSISQNKLYPQVRWGSILVKLLSKFGKKLSLKIQWRPFYDCLLNTHFTRNTGPEGWRLRQRHFETLTSLVRCCRRFFPAGSAFEIWSEFRPLLENPWHNSSFEGSGLVRLFLPTNLENQGFFSHDWIRQCIDHWNSIPNCPFWDSQWASVIARCIKNYKLMDWEEFLPLLFTRYLNLFEVPVANSNASFPFSVDVPRNTRFLFSNKAVTPAKAIAKSIVYLLKPGSSAQVYFEKLVNLLEQFYHPSNGGRWTYSLERFLRYLVITFEKRLKQEQLNIDEGKCAEQFLGKPDRILFIEVVLKLISRGQYSKSESLAETVAAATSILSYVEPSLVLPFVASRFHMALETMTATHQLTTAVMSVAYSGRVLYLASFTSSFQKEDPGVTNDFLDLLIISLSNALLGMDANDPPKTLATMQLIGSMFSNICELNENEGEQSSLPAFSVSEWLNEFLCRLFSMLQHLEPSSVLNEGLQPSATSGTFLVEDGPHYFCMLEILLGKLSKPLYSQALKKVSKFVTTNILPGAVYEVGLLCCACVHSNPDEAAVHLIEPLLNSILTSLRELPVTGYGGKGNLDNLISNKSKTTISPALETAIDYQLKILSVAVSYGGPVVLQYRDQFKESIVSAFEAPSWKINGAGDHVLRSLLGCLVFYYPMDQYKCISCHPDAILVEKWIGTKCWLNKGPVLCPKWHIPTEDELKFANELLDLHFCSALDDLLKLCQTKVHSEPGNLKEHMKVTLLRVDSSLLGVMSCLPDFCPSFGDGRRMEDASHNTFFIAGATGAIIGSSKLREKAAEIIHVACKYVLEERSDDSILLILVIRVIDALGNFGSLEYDEWSNHRQAWRLESSAIIEPSINFIDQSHSQGKKRPRWALIDKAYMHSTWRSSQSSYHLYRTARDISPPELLTLLMHDLLTLSLHSYETVRALAGKSLLKMLKRWPCMISKCILSLTENLHNPDSSEHAVLGSCAILSTQTVIKHLTVDPKAFSSFLLGVLVSSHHESLKCQKAINELFVKYNIHFAGVSRNIFQTSEGLEFTDLVSQIGSMSIDTNGLHWRYNLMANRILLLLTMTSNSEPDSSSEVLSEAAGHFLKNLRSQLPQTRILAISALNTLLRDSPHKISKQEPDVLLADIKGETKSSFQSALSQIYEEDGFFHETLNSLSHVHIISDNENTSSRGNHGASSFQSLADKSITRFYFDFSSSWPRTPSWISILGGDTFYSNFARIFKRLVQECGVPVLLSLKSSLEEFSNAKERSKQCVAAEVLAGVLHSDVNGLLGAWDSWISIQLQNVIQAPVVESLPDWAACIRYAVTGKGKYGTKVPLLRQKILDLLVTPLPQMVATNVVAKRYTFVSAALVEISPPRMPLVEIQIHDTLLKELLDNMHHTSAQVRESIGVSLTVLCSNVRLYESFIHDYSDDELKPKDDMPGRGRWDQILTERACELAQNIQKTGYTENVDTQSDKMLENVSTYEIQEDVKWMETMFHFVISSLKSGRSQFLLDIVVGLLYPVISLKETSNKDLSTLAKAAFELLKWRIFPEPHLQNTVSVILSLSNDLNWRTRFATLTYLRTFVHRHIFLLAKAEKQKIWRIMEKLLVDNQVEVREHAAAVLAGLMKGGDEEISRDFRDRAFTEALSVRKSRTKRRSSESIASVHGAVLALAASVLSVPYDMPRWLPEHVTLLAHFIGEPSPVRSTVMKAVAEFRRTHADTWNVQKDSFTEEQLEVLADTSSSASYFA